MHFRNVHVNGESDYATCDANGCATYLRASKFPFENALLDKTSKLQVREREFARLDVPASPPRPAPPQRPAFLPADSQVRKLEGGFFSISGAAVDAAGKLAGIVAVADIALAGRDKATADVVKQVSAPPATGP